MNLPHPRSWMADNCWNKGSNCVAIVPDRRKRGMNAPGMVNAGRDTRRKQHYTT